jgi:hypothetical protein
MVVAGGTGRWIGACRAALAGVAALTLWFTASGTVAAAEPPLPKVGREKVLTTSGYAERASTDVASDGSGAFVVWASRGDVHGTRVDAGGGPVGSVIPIATGATHQTVPAVAFTGASYLVTWAESDGEFPEYDIKGTRVSTAGAVLDAPAIVFADDDGMQYHPAVAALGSQVLVTWTDLGDHDPGDIEATRWSASTGVRDPAGIPIATGTTDQYDSALVGYGSGWFVVYHDDHGEQGTSKLGTTRVEPDGDVLDPAGVPLATTAHDQYAPSLAFDGTNVLVVWGDGDIIGARWSPTSGVLDPEGFEIHASPSADGGPEVAFNGSFLVVWNDRRDVSERAGDIYAARVGTDGTVNDPGGFAVSAIARDEDFAAVETLGDGWIVSYERGNLARGRTVRPK